MRNLKQQFLKSYYKTKAFYANLPSRYFKSLLLFRNYNLDNWEFNKFYIYLIYNTK